MAREWKKIDSRVVYSNQWIKVHEDKVIRPDGNEGIYAFIEKAPGNFIVALDDDGYAYLVNQYRYPVKKNILELPGGVADSDDLLDQAQKELFEETGISASKWEKLGGFYVATGHETTYANVFLATDLDLTSLKTSYQEGDELIQEIIKVDVKELKKMVLNGEVLCGISVAALNLFFLKYKK